MLHSKDLLWWFGGRLRSKRTGSKVKARMMPLWRARGRLKTRWAPARDTAYCTFFVKATKGLFLTAPQRLLLQVPPRVPTEMGFVHAPGLRRAGPRTAHCNARIVSACRSLEQ